MKFMVLSKADAAWEAGRFPEREEIEAMIAFNEQLANDGILVAAEGLHASSRGTRLRFKRGRTTAVDGPFAETKELIAGFWIVEGKSRQEIVERFKQAPIEHGELEVREFFGVEDFADKLTPEQIEITERVTLEDIRN